ncbi:hypothetical protein LDO31_17870 [Luteimonas sp. XNQY3]|nr:STY4528 family pathogenicity island replication protein [Luteimonas sp. XNQY3]MCD9008067.1 hypothetical protein [Luteimonas sp. XNQY3]
MSDPRRPDAPVALGDLLGETLDRLQALRPSAGSPAVPAARQTDGFIFSGSRHDSVPRALLLDNRLTPLERNAWQVVRLMLNDDGITTFCTYDQFAPWLASMPLTAQASHETVARAMTMLRLTRWISLVRRRRDPETGRVQGNLYVLHDLNLTPYEAIQLDPDYLGLVGQSLTHASKSIQRIGAHVLDEMVADPLLGKLPTRLHLLVQRLTEQGRRAPADNPQPVDNDDSEDGETAGFGEGKTQTSDSEAGDERTFAASLRNPKTGRTVRKKQDSKERTVPRVSEHLRLPDRFHALKAEQQAGALAAMRAVDHHLHQAILDEWDARCRASTVRNPAGYLFGIIQKAMHNEFRAWAGVKAPTSPIAHERDQPRVPSDRETALAQLDRLQSILRSP